MVPFLVMNVCKKNIENTDAYTIFILCFYSILANIKGIYIQDQLKLFECNMRKAKLWGGLIFRVGKDLVYK